LRQKATKAVEEFAEPIQRHFDSMEGGRVCRRTSVTVSRCPVLTLAQLSVASVADGFLHATTTMNDHSGDFLAHVFHSHGKQHPKDLTRAVIEEILTSSAIWSATIASVLEYYLEDSRKDDRIGLAHATDEQMLVAINEALRKSSERGLDGTHLTVYQVSTLPSLPFLVVPASRRTSTVKLSMLVEKSSYRLVQQTYVEVTPEWPGVHI
jgi:hypothetical protein